MISGSIKALFLYGQIYNLNLIFFFVVYNMKSRIHTLPKFEDKRGNLSYIENHKQIPFEINRAYLIYDVPGGQKRGGHGYKKLEELIVALSGSFDVIIDEGNKKKTFHLNRSYIGLYVPPLVWRTLDNFSTNSLALILASRKYEEKDYIRDYNHFKNLIKLN